MKRDKPIGFLIIGLGVCLFFVASLADVFYGRTFSLGPAQTVLMVLGASIIGSGLLLIYRKSIYVESIKKLSGYFQLRGEHLRKVFDKRNVLLYFFILFILGLFVFAFYLWGIEEINEFPDYIGADAPIIVSQVLIAIAAGIICIIPNFFGRSTNRSKIIGAIICVALFGLAYKLWMSLPIGTSFFLRHVSPTSSVLYPFSDSRKYDMNALALLNGEGLGFGLPFPRPLYTLFLVVLHVLFNHAYSSMILAQVTCFALLPVLAFILGDKFGSRAVGVILAMLIIYQEYNQTILSSRITMVSVQMMMSEVFTELFIVVLVILTFQWFSHLESRNWAAVTGVWLGLTALIRTQAILFLAIYLAYWAYKFFLKERKKAASSLVFFVALSCVLFPWMIRNYVRGGSLSLEGTDYFLNSVTTNGNNASIIENDAPGSGDESMDDLVITQGGFYLGRTFAFINNNIVDSLYQFPFSFQPLNLKDYISSGLEGYPIPYEQLSTSQAVCAFIQACIIVLGIAFSMRKFGFKGLFPILVYLAYNISGAVLGYTGYRFIQPVDWIFLLYWSAGVVALVLILLPARVLFNFNAPDQALEDGQRISPWVIGAIILAGILLPVSDLLSPKVVNPLPDVGLLSKSIASSSIQIGSQGDLPPLTLTNGFLGISGYGLYSEVNYAKDEAWITARNSGLVYPAYYSQHIVWDDDFTEVQVSKGTNILYFILTTDKARDVLMDDPIVVGNENNGLFFNDSQVFVLGCDEGDYIQAYYMQIKKDSVVYEIKSNLAMPERCTP